MAAKKQQTIDDLRARLTERQHSILNEIWRYWHELKKITPAVALYTKFGKEIVDSELKSLGGSVVFRTGSESDRGYYQLTFLGMLLTIAGLEGQKLIESYLAYVRSRLVSEPELNHLSGDVFDHELGFTEQQYGLFVEFLRRSPFWQGSNEATRTVYGPIGVDALATTPDVHCFFEARTLEDYDPDRPLDWSLQDSLVKTDDEEELVRTAPAKLTRTKLVLLGVGTYILYFAYVLSSRADNPEGLYAFRYRWLWWMVFGQTLWLLIAVLAVLLLAMVLGVEGVVNLFPWTRLLLLKPISASVSHAKSLDGFHSDNLPRREEFSEQTGLGFQLYLDYNDSIKRVYNNAIVQYRNSFYFSLIFATVGFGVIFYTLVFRNNANTSWPAVVVSAIIEAVPALFFYLSDKARKQMIEVFVDLRHDNEIARAYELLRTMRDPQKLEALKEEIIRYTLLTNSHNRLSTRTVKIQNIKSTLANGVGARTLEGNDDYS